MKAALISVLISFLALVAGMALGEKAAGAVREKCSVKALTKCTNCTSLCANPKCIASCDDKGNVVSLNILRKKYKEVPKAVGKLSHLSQL